MCNKQVLNSNIIIENEKLETVQYFTHLGIKIILYEYDGNSETKIKKQNSTGKTNILLEDKPIHDKHRQSSNQRNTYKQFCMYYSAGWSRTWPILKEQKGKETKYSNHGAVKEHRKFFGQSKL